MIIEQPHNRRRDEQLPLDDVLLDRIADRVAEKLIVKLTERIMLDIEERIKIKTFAAIGKTLVEKLFYMVGVSIVAIFTFLHYKGAL